MRYKVLIIILNFLAISATGQSNLIPFASLSPQQGSSKAKIYDFETLNGNLYVIGEFDSIGGISAKNIAMFDGTNWSSLPIILDDPIALEAFKGELYVLGHTGQIPAEPLKDEWISKWTGNQWLSLGDSAIIVDAVSGLGPKAIESFDGILYVAGKFTGYSGFPNKNNFAAYDGSSWIMSDDGSLSSISLWSLESNSSYLVVGGDILSANGAPANNLATWNGSSYTPYMHPGSGPFVGSSIPGGEYLFAAGYLYQDSIWQSSRLKGGEDDHVFYADKLITGLYGLVHLIDTNNLNITVLDTLPWFNNSYSKICIYDNNVIFGANYGSSSNTIYSISLSSIVSLKEEIKSDFFKVYPNPIKDQLSIELEENYSISVWNPFGRLEMRKDGLHGLSILDCRNLQNGVYMLQVQTNEGIVVKKVLKN